MHAFGSLRVVALVRNVEWEHHIRDTLGASSIIRWVRDDSELHAAAGLASANIVLWHLEPSSGPATVMVATLRRIRTVIPLSAVVLSCRVAPEIAPLILAAGRLGVDRVALRGYDDLERVVNDVLQEQRRRGAVNAILARLELSDRRAAPLVAHIIRHAFEAPRGVEHIAHELGIDRKTLHNRLRAAGLPSPATLMSWSRLLAAGWLLDDPLHSVASVGRSLRFTSASELRGMFARYVHARPTDIRRRGALDAILEAFRAAMARSGVTRPTHSPSTDGLSQSQTRRADRAS